MTVGFWFLFGALALVGVVVAFFCFASDAPVGGVITLLITVIVLGGLLWFGSQYYSNTASGARAVKDQQLDWSQGVERLIQVIESDGSVSYEYRGKVDIEMHDNYIVFDENNKRVILYKSYTSTLVITEIQQSAILWKFPSIFYQLT